MNQIESAKRYAEKAVRGELSERSANDLEERITSVCMWGSFLVSARLGWIALGEPGLWPIALMSLGMGFYVRAHRKSAKAYRDEMCKRFPEDG